ncbi:MAG: three-Cys-motif partner protein TcmP [Aureispira sp.]|nr:three-Cys-motif partner protein TcmP [Aureispira sp.]
MSTSRLYPFPKNELEVRSNIILKYFKQWSAQLIQTIKIEGLEEKFAFIDLCAGFGLENSPPTSCLKCGEAIATKVLQLTAKNKALRSMLSTVLNDKETEVIAHITKDITNIDLIKTLTFQPSINLSEVDAPVFAALSLIKTLPTLVVLDWWNYKGINLELLQNLVTKSTADCLFIFDYKSILSAFPKKSKQEDLIRIFGATILHQLKENLKGRIPVYQKEKIILKALRNRLTQAVKTPYLLQYKFYDSKNKTSHFLFFISQNQAAYTLMREVFCSESQVIEDGIGNLEYNPNKGVQQKITSQTLFGSMFHLEQDLLQTYKSQTLQMIDIYENHHSGKALVKKNYIDALLNLERKNQITVTRKRQRMRLQNEIGLNDSIFVSFNK